MKKLFFLIVASLIFSPVSTFAATIYELESCQFVSSIADSDGNTSPPGLDEPLRCDHNCFYDELGISELTGERPNLHDMYSIGWRLIHLEKTTFRGREVWWVYLERESDKETNSCDEIYAPRNPNDPG